jgi:hypothetical protein
MSVRAAVAVFGGVIVIAAVVIGFVVWHFV